MQRRLTRGAHQVRVDCDAGNPRQPLTGEDKGPGVALLTRHARVNKDVLQLPCATAADRPHGQARPAKTKAHIETVLQVDGFLVVATDASSHLEARARSFWL